MELAKEKTGYFLYRLFCPKDFFNISVLSRFIVYWIHFQNIQALVLYQKTSLHAILLLVFKIVESLQCILKYENVVNCSIISLFCKFFWLNLIRSFVKIIFLYLLESNAHVLSLPIYQIYSFYFPRNMKKKINEKLALDLLAIIKLL